MPKRAVFVSGFLKSVIGILLCVPSGSLSVGESRPFKAIQWDNAAMQGVRDAKMGAPMAARALAIMHTCMYDAWAAYDGRAVGTQLSGALRRPASERTLANKERAISYAAYRALTDVLPGDTNSVYRPLMKELGYDPDDKSADIETPTGIGNVACAAVLEFRHHDKANQLGKEGSLVSLDRKDEFDRLGRQDVSATAAERSASEGLPYTGVGATSPYGDWSGYRPVNAPGTIPAHAPFVKPMNPEHWQPLLYTDANGNLVLQMFEGAQWCYVTPFALASGEEFRSAVEPGPFKFGSAGYEQQAEELVALSAGLTDEQKMAAEYWSDGPETGQPLGHWMEFAQFVSARDHHTLDDDVKMYFTLTNSMFDATIAAWDAKRTYDSVRPVTAISLLFRGKKIRAWGGPGKGTFEMDGSQWIPYQLATSPATPSPEYVSGQSTYSAAVARILTLWTGSDHFGNSVTLPAGSSKIEPGITPFKPVTMGWETFTEAADEAGMSQRYGGIHFARSDLAGRKLGRLVADRVWAKTQGYFAGTNSASFQQFTAAK